MNCGQNLSLPMDIPWKRMAFSADMFDNNFMDPELPNKWNTSISVFYHQVPEEETNEMYPDRRIMYLKVVSSITGCNFQPFWGPFLLDSIFEDVEEFSRTENLDLDSFQQSTLQTINRLLAYYYPCKGAILQLAVFPHHTDNEAKASLWNFPYIQDFEPKKRELYETVSRTGEVLSGSSSNINTRKGLTATSSTEESDITTGYSGEVSAFGVSASASYTGEWGTREHTGRETTNALATDNSREKRETQSHATSINQMYQPLLSYHIGTNRALWVISPRPNTVDSENTLINISPSQTDYTEEGVFIGRQLEGIQDMFLVINMPKESKGLCIQANLDTGYDIDFIGTPPSLEDVMAQQKPGIQLDIEQIVDQLTQPQPLAEKATIAPTSVVVMRRIIRSCGKFGENGNFSIDNNPIPTGFNTLSSFSAGTGHPLIVNEIKSIPNNIFAKMEEIKDPNKKAEMIFKANQRNQFIKQKMLNGISSNTNKPKLFVETDMFNSILESSLTISMQELSELNVIKKEKNILEELQKRGVKTVGDLMRTEYKKDKLLISVRKKMIESTLDLKNKLIDFQQKKVKNSSSKEKKEN